MLSAFSTAKAKAARHASSKIIEFVNAEDHTTRVSSAVPLHKPLFESTPAEIWIDEYIPFHTTTIKLSFRNCDTVARRFKIEPSPSPIFKLLPLVRPSDKGRIDGKIAAGMETAFQLEFYPQEVKDYAVDLVCATERERFLLPVRVRGRRAALDIPDTIHFGFCPVKMATTKVLAVHNVGNMGARFAFSTTEWFSIVPASAALEQGASVQLELTHRPPILTARQGELMITDDTGQSVVVELAGDVGQVDVYLSQPLVEPNATYLSLSSRKTVKICNESEYTLEFSWKAFPDQNEEEAERGRLLDELARLEATEMEQLNYELLDAEHSLSTLSHQSPFNARKTVETKYRNLRKAALEDNMQFVDDCFSLQPMTGRVWAHSEVDVVTCFSPAMALLYSCSAFLDIAGQEARLPLQIRGQGIGPKAKVVYNELLDFGDVFISDKRTRDFTIQNKGEIPAVFELQPMQLPAGVRLDVQPAQGTLALNEMRKIEVSFFSQVLGDEFQHIRFRLQGSEDQLLVRFKAHVIPPVFHFDVDLIDFGAVSYSFPHTKTVKLINASKIAMEYVLRIPEEANYKHKEFELTPPSGSLEAYGEQEIVLHFTSFNVKSYDYHLVVNVAAVGSDLLSVPIRAQCFAPEIVIQHPDLEFGACFLRYPHKQTMLLENKSAHLFGRFEISEQDDHSRAIATYTASEATGSIGPGEIMAVDIFLSCEKLGSIRLPMTVTVPGSTDLPLAVTLTAVGTGPKVALDQNEIHWGNCTCLVDHERLLTMTNASLIPAYYKTFIRNARSKFQIDQNEGTLPPGETVQFVLVANLDDTVVFKDQLHILITEGDNIVLPLAIKGVGTTMWSPSELRVIDFGHQMTCKECEWSCTLENKGKRSQVLTWTNRTAAANKKAKLSEAGLPTEKKPSALTKSSGSGSKASKASASGSNSQANDIVEEVIPVFSVFPGTIELKPRTACVFVFKGLSASAGLVLEELVCETRVGKEKVNKIAFVTQIQGNFLDPKLTPSVPNLSFEYIHYPRSEINRQSQPLSLTNACALPLSFTLRTQTPFSLDCWEAVLQPGEQVAFNVEFYPGYKDDYTCRVINGKVFIAYTGHPQKDSIDLLGDISFPNLSFDTTKIDFGCTLNDTQTSIFVEIANVSKVDTSFRWVFIEDEKDARANATAKKPYMPINQVFDILPIRGLLKPNEHEKIEFIYYGHANRKFKSTVACEVDGGPEYELSLLGEASSLVYKLDKQCLDFGQVLYNKIEDREFSILNVGKVSFAFNIVVEGISRGRSVEVTPMVGKIAPNDKQRILVRLRPGIPEQFDETIVIEVAHFQPIEFKLFGNGIFSSVLINLPRENHPSSTIQGENPKWKNLKKIARRNLETSTLSEALVNRDGAMSSSDSKSTISATTRGIVKVNSFRSVAKSVSPTAKAPSPQKFSVPGGSSRFGAGSGSGSPIIDDLDIETEACRVFFAEYLILQDAKKLEPKGSGKLELIEPEESSETMRMENSKEAVGEKPMKRKAPETFPFILSQFVLEFGNVVLGTHKIKKFSITNIGHVPASFQLDKNLALSKGFQIEPERVVRLPEKQAVEFTVTFQARKSIVMGIHQAQLPIVMKNGPPSLLTIRAHVTVPDIAISMDTLDFGKMAVSTCHTMFTQIHNTSTVAAEWAIKKPMGSARDISNFRISPQMGVLAPGAKANLQVAFVPDDGRLFSIKLPIKVNANPKTRSITCRGEGSELRVSFNPAMVELGPMLPCSDFSKALVEIRNDSEYPVEVFSLDFDQQFKQDEGLFRTLSVYNADGMLQLPVRVPGQSLQQYLVDKGLLQVNSPDPVNVQRLEGMEDDNPDHAASATNLFPPEQALTASESVSNVVDDTPENPKTITRTGVDYVLLGPPRCGISTQAQLLAEKENLTAWTIDDTIKAACLEQNDLGRATRDALGLEHDEIPEENANAPKLSPASSSSELQESPNNDLNGEQNDGEHTRQSKIELLLDQMLLWRLTQPDLRHGSVLDGCDSSLVSFEAVIRACNQVLLRARVVWLSFDEDAYETMINLQTRITPSSSKVSIHASSKASLTTSPEIDEDAAMAADENQFDLDHKLAVDSMPVNEDDVVIEECDNQQTTTSIERQFSALMRNVSANYKSTTFSTYQLVLEMRRRQVMWFLACKAHNNTTEFAIDFALPETGALATRLHDLVRSDNFLLDIPISEPGPALHMHSMIHNAIEKCVRELDSSHLVVPPAAKYQMIHYPPERFARKPVSRFILRHPPPDSLTSDPEFAKDETLIDFDSIHEQKVNDKDENAPDPEHQTATRWVIPAHESAYTSVHFETSDVGVFDCVLGFEIVGVRREFNLFCRGTCSVPTINSDPRNVFMSRVKSRPEGVFVHKKFVLSRNQFEFGPLIVTNGANLPEREEEFVRALKSSTSNIEVFRMTNTSRWPIQIDFGLENEEDKSFAVFPLSINVAEGETGEVKVWACPLSDGLHENSLVCCISDNPLPYTFAVTCYGCTPNLVLRGPWEQTVACSTSEEESPRDESASKSPAGPSLDFEQLLLKRQDEKTFFLENVSHVGVIWRLAVADLPSDFRLFPMEGVIKPFQKAPVLVVFSANVEAVYKHPVMIEYSDSESALQVAERKQFTRLLLQAEAYKIDVCSFQQESESSSSDSGDSSLDFGLVRVGESHARVFNIRNQGKYNIKFVVTIRKTSSRSVFTIEPSEMVLEPNGVAPVTVTFHSKQEITLRDCKDIKCTIIEMISGEPCREFHVLTTAKSVFSVFRLQSNRGINFGPLTYNDPPKSKKFEIKNEGAFPFKYRVLPSTVTRASDVVVDDADVLTLETPLTPATLTAGQFSITPDGGSIDPGVTAVLDVVFQPKDCEVYREMLRIEISGRDLQNTAESDMLMYELVAESCYPGINTTDYDSIFEEQIVIPTIGTNAGSTTTTTLTKSSTSGATGMAWHSVIFAERERLFSFGAMIAAASAKGTVERFKISNPTKVATTVHFMISPSSNFSPSGGNGGSTPRDDQTLMHAFTVQPSTWEIPPLEHRFVSVYFKPTAIMTYYAQFIAKVDDSPQHVDVSRDITLRFDLRGEGTMPCVTVVEPTQRDSNGVLQMNFGRVRLVKLKELPLTLRNDGILPATVLFSMQSNPNYVFSLGNGSIVVPPKASETLNVAFKPQKAHDEPSICLLKITVQNNPFEETSLRLTGIGYKEDVTFEDLPLGHDDELHFDDIHFRLVSAGHHSECHPESAHSAIDQRTDIKVFSICNQSSDIMRFVWPKSPVFQFSPTVGHLKPRSFKLITATFAPVSGPGESRATVYHAHQVPLQLQRITYHDPSSIQGLPDWDETIRTVTFDTQSNGHGSTGEKLAEPAYESIGAATTVNLNCFAAADTLSYECDVASIAFKRTFMLQVCSHRITIRNKSKIKLAYAWKWEHGNGMDTYGLFSVQTSNTALDDECPFEISPESGTIAAEESQVFAIKFAPLEVDDFEYMLVFEPVEAQHHIDAGDRPSLHILVRGSSVRPACHFDVERSDYAQRRAPHLVGPNGELGSLDPAIKVIEMESLGVRVRNTRRFYVVNPTNVSYEFSWTPESEVSPCFRCATPKGLMLAGKRCEMIFEFTPQQLELQEMFWRFKIPQFEVNQLFLFVGTTTEPRVTLDRGSINFNTLLIGTKTSQSIALINHEHIPFNFVFDKASLDFAGEAPALLVHPLSGVIPPNSRSSIDIEFIPMEEKTYNFNISCIVKRKPTRLSLNVKGEGYSIHDALTISSDDQNNLRSALLGPGNILDFGIVRVNDESMRTVVIHNSGKFNFEFNWNVIKPVAAFAIEPMQGTVKKNDKVACRLVYAPTKQSSLEAQISCTVASSRVYGFNLHGSAVPPSLQFSFTSHDFGPCFVAEADSLPISETVVLTIFNMDPEIGIDLDCVFEKKTHLRVDCPPTALGPRESFNVPIVFTARQETTYMEMIPFVLNGSSTVSVSIRGEGVPPRIELVNTSMQNVAFGSLQIGQQVSRSIKIANRSKRKTLVEFLDVDSAGLSSLSQLGISIFPHHEVTLRPKETADIEFKFAPTQRVPAFQKDVFIQIAGSRKKLLTLNGCCQGMDIALESDTLSFGTVCLGSQLTRKLRLQNRGDMAAKFQWNVQSFAPDFQISPVEGMIAPNQQKTLEVTFKPFAVNADIRYDRLMCSIDGAAPLLLACVGSCVKQSSSSISDMIFDSPVREESTKPITIENKSKSPWNLFPVVQGEHWSCPDNIAVPAEGKATLDVKYLPLRMTRQPTDPEDGIERPEQHEGSIFLAIPDGSALLYNVFGKASPPASAGSLSLTTPAKKTLSITISVKNWLKVAQTFVVEIRKPEENESVMVQGPSSITLQAGSTRNYNLKFFCYTETKVNLTVRFVNADSGEYLMYDVTVAVSTSAEVETLYFEAPARQAIKKMITIENPFPANRLVAFADSGNWWKCSSLSIRVRQISEMTGRPEGCYEIEYRPTIHSVNPIEATLTISFADLGDYTYKLILATQVAGIERILYFKAPLGGSQTQTFPFVSYSDKSAELTCSVREPTFFSVPSICKVDGSTDWEGKSCSVQIGFEPEALGEIRDTLTLFSDVVGEYKCALQGVSMPPLPQGPFVFVGSKDLEFKNVFSSTKDFELMVDNPLIVLSTKTMSITAKAAKTVTVRAEALATGPAPATGPIVGKLFISCPSLPELPPWIYYLEATLAST